MKLKPICLSTALLLLLGMWSCVEPKQEVQNDSNTPLHLLQPAYNTPYGPLTVEEIKADLDRVLHYLEKSTPTRVVSKTTGEEITDFTKIDADAQLERGAYRLASYEWGVTYSAMLTAAEATGDEAYYNYVADRFKFLAAVAPHYRKLMEAGEKIDPQMRQILDPHALDDAGAVCAAMVKAQMKDNSLELMPLIENYMDFILHKEYRLSDGTFARTRPQYNTLWLDDMFMGIPPIAWYSNLAGEKQQECLKETVRQVLQFAERMWVPEKKLFRHGWVEGMGDHPAFHWGRANGWALLTMCEVLDVLPENYPGRAEIMELFREHVRGLAACRYNVHSTEGNAFTTYYGASMRLRTTHGVMPIGSEMRLSDGHQQSSPLALYHSGKKTDAHVIAALYEWAEKEACYFCLFQRADYNYFMLPEVFEKAYKNAR